MTTRNEIRNYSVHAVEETLAMADYLGESDKSRTDAAAFRRVAAALTKAVKFIGPMNGIFFEKPDEAKLLELFRLPFPSIALEYTYDLEHEPWVAADAPGNKRDPDTRITGTVVLAEEAELNGKNGVLTTMFLRVTSFPWRWQPSCISIFVPYGAEAHLLEADGKLRPAIDLEINIHSPYLLGEIARGREETPDQAASFLAQTIWNSTLSIRSLCGILNCSNVRVETVPPSEKLNRKRVSNGKLPFEEYRVLTVDMEPREPQSSRPGMIGRQSPRQHFRRGHIRRYQSGLSIWIQPQLIGDPSLGKITKDYEIRKGGKVVYG